MMHQRRTFPLLLAALLAARSAAGQATLKVPPTAHAYETLDALAAAGLIRYYIHGQRPLSRATIARLLGEAQSRLDSLRVPLTVALQGRGDIAPVASSPGISPELRRTLQLLEQEFAPELRMTDPHPDEAAPGVRWHQSVELDVLRATSPTRRVPSNNLAGGQIDAVVNPLLTNVEGRRLEQGNNSALEMMSGMESAHLALEVRPRFWTGADRTGAIRSSGSLEELQARLLLGNLAIDAGRQYLVWGQGREVGLIDSNNSPALDLVQLSNEDAARLPWVFRRLGPGRYALFVADLGSQQNFPHALFIGYKLSFAPTSSFEMGGVVYTKEGGEGAPGASLSARLTDLFPFLDRSAYNNRIGFGGNFEFSHHYAGVDARWRLPHTNGATAYAEVTLNDFDTRRLGSVMWEDAAHVFGVSLPQSTMRRPFSTSFEYHHTGLRYYEHQTYTSGQTLRETLTGDPLGPDATGSYATLEWQPTSRHTLQLELAIERLSNDQYTVVPVFTFVRTEGRPKERRQRAMLRWVSEPMPHNVNVLAGLGVERETNFDFVVGQNRLDGLAQVGLQWCLR